MGPGLSGLLEPLWATVACGRYPELPVRGQDLEVPGTPRPSEKSLGFSVAISDKAAC